MKTFLALFLFVAAAVPESQTLTIKGSDTMVILVQQWAERYMAVHKETTIQVTGGGSGTGISALINGTTDICASSRPMKPAEAQKLRQKYGRGPVEIKVAKDGIAIYVNEKNPVSELTIEQIRLIYTGKVTNWKQVGGSDAKIILYSRENNSGTYAYFKEEVLANADFAPQTQSLPGTAGVVNSIARDVNGIGYGGSAYGKGIRELKVKRDAASSAVAPTVKNILAGTYPITRFLYFYTKSRPDGAVKGFIDYALSPEGQKTVSEVGYFPLR
ncbi:MAG: phosphate ABC transporter substrate-binding protein [Bacteroidetes bacterium]|jgi:phosphate transport system substrate-binding protein|nr:phosphate ABC transporter substrate-binding protein [Bacteroidota bacterium]